MNIYQKICQVTTQKERRRLLWLTIPVCLFALLNVAGVGVIMPFIAVAGDSSLIYKSHLLSWMYHGLHFTDPQHFLIFLGSLCFAFLCLVNSCGALLVWLNARITNDLGVSMGTRLLNIYLHQPYQFYLNQHSANMANRVLSMVSQVKTGVIYNGIAFVSGLLVIVSLAALLLYSHPQVAVSALCLIAVSYMIIFNSVKHRLERVSKDQVELGQKIFKAVGEAFGGIKDLALNARQGYFINIFQDASVVMSKHQSAITCIQGMPRYLLEIVAFGGVIVMVLWMLSTGQALAQLLPTLAMFVYAGYRLLPASQNMMNAFATCKASMGALNILCHDFSVLANESDVFDELEEMEAMAFDRMFTLNHLSYAYPGCKDKVLDDVNITIKANQVIGIIGATGAGKTTLVDMMLGLLTPSVGALSVDGVKLEKSNIRSWQKQLGYVSQHIYLSDDTVAHNIAFGMGHHDVDYTRVEEVAKAAAIHDFVVGDLPKAYDTEIGENGVRLSGGQRQRIGIARALYHNPSVLVLDEATSALDGATESAVMDAIHSLAHQKTIIIIAHRLTTVAKCDSVFLMANGKVVDQGPFRQLLERHPLVQEMANLAAKA